MIRPAQHAGESVHPNLWQGLVGAWSLDEPGGLIAFDRFERYPGTLTNMEAATDHIIGHWREFSFGALNFVAASTQYIAIPNGLIARYPLTLVATFRIADVGANQTMLALNDDTDAANWKAIRFITSGSELHAGDWNGPSIRRALTSVTVDIWHQAAAVFAGQANRTIYLDGVAKNQNMEDAGAILVPNVCGIGRFSDLTPSAYMNGDIAECLVYNRALTAADVKTLYDIGPGGIFQLRRRVFAGGVAAPSFVPYPRPRGLGAGLHALSGGLV